MSNDRSRRIRYAQNQIKISEMYILKIQTEILSGHTVTKDTSQGREPTAEEAANGVVIGWTPHTDQQKIANALAAIQNHIQFMTECNDTINNLMEEEENFFQRMVEEARRSHRKPGEDYQRMVATAESGRAHKKPDEEPVIDRDSPLF